MFWKSNTPTYSNDQISATLACIGDGVIITDTVGRITYINPAAVQITGWSAENALGLDFDAVFPVIDALTGEKMESPVRAALSAGSPIGLHRYSALVTRAQSTKMISASCSPVIDSNGGIIGIVIVFRDITRIRNMEDELRLERNNLNMYFESNPMGMVIVDEHAIIRLSNPAFLKMVGMDSASVEGQKIGNGLGCLNGLEKGCGNGQLCGSCELSKNVGKVLDKWEPCNNVILQYTLISRGAVLKPWFKLNFVPVTISGRRNVMVVFDDITEQKRNEEILTSAMDHYLKIFENFPTLIWRTGTDRMCNYINKSWLNFTGRTQEEELGNGWMEGVHPDDREFILKRYNESTDLQLPFEMEYRLQRHDGEYRWMLDAGRPFYDLNGNFAGYIGTLFDITERRKTQEQLEKARKAAEAANRVKSEFLANMSHEIRTPLNGIVGMINMTMLSDDLNEEHRENLNVAKLCVNTLLKVINDILDFSKLEAGKLLIDNISFSLRSLFDNVIKAHSVQGKEKNLELSCRIASDIPDTLLGDPGRLKQILDNLIGNALKFTQKGRVEIHTDLRYQREDLVELLFKVEDTGIGISTDEMGRLFKSFSQADGSYTRKFGGTGLGLAISKQLVEMMGGTIWVESEKDVGSSFQFTLPFYVVKDKPEESSHQTAGKKTDLTLQVLVVEDDKVNQIVFAKMLKEKGHQYQIAGNGKEALELFRKTIFDIVIMDIQMPEMDGVETTRRIRQMEAGGRHTPIIAVTAYALRGDREKFLSCGMDDYLAKPVQIDEMYRMLERYEMKVKEQSIHKLLQSGNGNAVKMPDRTATLKEIGQMLEVLKNALENNDLAGLEGGAGNVKRLASALQADELKRHGLSIELAARRGDLKGISKKLPDLVKEYEGLTDCLKSEEDTQ